MSAAVPARSLSRLGLHQRRDARTPDGLVDRPDLFVDDDAVGIQHIGFRGAINPPVESDCAVRIGDDRAIRIAMSRQPALCIGIAVPVINADVMDALRRQLHKERLFDFSGRAPNGEDRTEEQTSEPKSVMSISYADFCLK